jgi:hypothetical protein
MATVLFSSFFSCYLDFSLFLKKKKKSKKKKKRQKKTWVSFSSFGSEHFGIVEEC